MTGVPRSRIASASARWGPASEIDPARRLDAHSRALAEAEQDSFGAAQRSTAAAIPSRAFARYVAADGS